MGNKRKLCAGGARGPLVFYFLGVIEPNVVLLFYLSLVLFYLFFFSNVDRRTSRTEREREKGGACFFIYMYIYFLFICVLYATDIAREQAGSLDWCLDC